MNMNGFNFLLSAPINQTIIVPLLLLLVIMPLQGFISSCKLPDLSFARQLPVQDEFHLIRIEPRLLLWYLVMYLPESDKVGVE